MNEAHTLQFDNQPTNFPDHLKEELKKFIINQINLQQCTQAHFAEVKGIDPTHISFIKNKNYWKNLNPAKWYAIAKKVGFRIGEGELETASIQPPERAEKATHGHKDRGVIIKKNEVAGIMIDGAADLKRIDEYIKERTELETIGSDRLRKRVADILLLDLVNDLEALTLPEKC